MSSIAVIDLAEDLEDGEIDDDDDEDEPIPMQMQQQQQQQKPAQKPPTKRSITADDDVQFMGVEMKNKMPDEDVVYMGLANDSLGNGNSTAKAKKPRPLEGKASNGDSPGPSPHSDICPCH